MGKTRPRGCGVKPTDNLKPAMHPALVAAMLALSVAGYRAMADDRPEPPAKARAFRSNLMLLVHELIDGATEFRGTTGLGVKKAINLPARADWVVQPVGG